MTFTLIPRSDNISAKVVEASDFEKYFDSLISDYTVSGFTMSAGSGLAVTIAAGIARINGLHVESTATETVSSLTASDVNYIYATISRCASSEPQSWSFTKNLTGVVPTDSLLIGTATTDGSSVTSVSQVPETSAGGLTGLRVQSGISNSNIGLVCGNDISTGDNACIPKTVGWFGNGVDGDVTISADTTLSETKYYDNLTINACKTLDTSISPQIIFVRETLTISGTISSIGQGAAGGAGGAGGTSTYYNSAGAGAVGSSGTGATNLAAPGGAGGTSATCGSAGSSPGGAGSGGGSGAGGPGGAGGQGPGSTAGKDGDMTAKSGGSGGSSATTDRSPNNIIEYLGSKSNLIGAGGGGGGGTSSGGPGGMGGGDSQPNSPAGGNGGNGGAGGTGGAGGGTLIIAAQNVIINASGSVKAEGATGGDGGDGGIGSVGAYGHGVWAGGGGGGGFLGLYYFSLTNNGTLSVAAGGVGTAGSGGAGGAGGDSNQRTDGVPGGAGAPSGSAAGSTGTAGLALQVSLKEIL